MESDDSRNVFDVHAEMAALPATATTMLVDKYFVDKPSASARIFRIYREVPLHYHEECDEHLYLLSGGGTFHLDGGPTTSCSSTLPKGTRKRSWPATPESQIATAGRLSRF